MIVGVYHLGDTPDVIKIEQKNDYDVKLQAEEVVDALSRFYPTKLAVEVEWKGQAKLNEKYRKYQQGDLNLTKNEIEMIGFPLAKQSGISEVSCVDWMRSEEHTSELQSR